VRRWIIRWQLRNLDEQCASILEARQHALSRLMEIQRESVLKQQQLGQSLAREVSARSWR
jgi:hypothetical protein